MKRTLLLVVALFFPWITFLVIEKPLSALAALALQLTFVGWLPASIWAWAEIKRFYAMNPMVTSSQAIPKTENINQGITEKQAVSPPPTSTEGDNQNPSQPS